jgi:nitroreductase
MTLKDLVLKNRSYRRFHEDHPIGSTELHELVELARLSPCARNDQALRFLLSCTRERNARIFPHLGWAGFIEDWPGPADGERPTAYIIVLGDREIRTEFGRDAGIASQSILLGAAEKGLGGCIIGSVRRDALREALSLPERFEIVLAIALGSPSETVVIDPVGPEGSTRYWRDPEEVHHVPKRTLDDLILD